jgi:hypothetical protein
MDLARKENGLHPFIFMNNASEKQQVLRSYAPDNFAKLLEISRRYDPNRVLQTGQKGGHKLGL